jgi:hypothetical protein
LEVHVFKRELPRISANYFECRKMNELESWNILSMHGFANHAQRRLQIAVRRFEGVSINGEGRAENDERGTVFGALDGLFQTEATDGLDWDFDGIAYFTELIQRARHALASGGNAATLIVTNVVNHIVAAEVFQPLGS